MITWILLEHHLLRDYHYLLYFCKELGIYKQEERQITEWDYLCIPGHLFPGDLIKESFFYENVIGAPEYPNLKEAVNNEPIKKSGVFNP